MLADSVLGVDKDSAQHGLVAILALLTLLLICRFVFGNGRRKPVAGPDFGLLVAVAAMPTRAAAEIARDLLARNGIRATLHDRRTGSGPVHITADGRELPREVPRDVTDLLVFPTDADAARALLGSGG